MRRYRERGTTRSAIWADDRPELDAIWIRARDFLSSADSVH
jgi:hypothetical protein